MSLVAPLRVGRLLLALMAGALVLVGCFSRSARKAARLEGQFVLGDPGEGWTSVSPGGADHAFHNDSLGATIYADSNCGSRYEDSPLPDLAKHLTFGVGQGELLIEGFDMLDGREAYTARMRGALDGVPVELGVTVVKKDRCVYDVVVVGPPDSRFESAWEAFGVTVAGFRTTR